MEQQVIRRSIFNVLIEEFENCTDFRDLSRVFFSLPEILFLTFCAVLSGCETYEEIADTVGCPVGTVRSRLHRGRNLLKDALYTYATTKGYPADAHA